MTTTPEPRCEVVELLRQLAVRYLLEGPDAAGIAWTTRYGWSTAAERVAALDPVVDDALAAIAIYHAVADQQDASLARFESFDEQAFLDSIGVAAPHPRDGDT